MGEDAAKIVWLAGASGLVGAQVLEGLLQSTEYSRIVAVTRRPLGREAHRLANRIVRFAQLETQLRGQACGTALCCLGAAYTSVSAEPAYRESVQTNVLAFARAAKAAGARRFVMLSCHTADSKAKRAAPRVLGETLDALLAMGFESLDILLPGPLLGLRRGAGLGDVLSMTGTFALRPLQFGAREPRRAVTVGQVAAAMVGAARSGRRGVYRYDYSGILSLSRMRGRT